MRPKTGFTVIELLTIVGIIGIIAAVTIPSVMAVLPGFYLNGATKELIANLQLARAKSVRYHKNVIMIFNASTRSYMAFFDSNGDWLQNDLVDNTDGSSGADGLVDPGEETTLAKSELRKGATLVSALFSDHGGPTTAQTDTDGDNVLDNNLNITKTNAVGFGSNGLLARSPAGNYINGSIILRNEQGLFAKIEVTISGQILFWYSNDGVNWRR